jgi:hypothetical protein
MGLTKKNGKTRSKKHGGKRKTRSKKHGGKRNTRSTVKGGTKPKKVVFNYCETDFECPMEALTCDTKNNICVQKYNFIGGKTRKTEKVYN